jgi:hypothetical protein
LLDPTEDDLDIDEPPQYRRVLHMTTFGLVGDGPMGSPLTIGKSPLKTRNKAKHTLPNHAGYGPRCGDLNDPPRRPS